ncbi:DUF4124 domain-containing protein [Cognatilysobacter segetis]|uniref:DUF4124 domain-containing protein n=1 Tax=Cognatilysobacter segetis TaxID=2492394 RepID=UPI00105D29E3|nr:DUF4124 domain-containing protein [Lysobacter segetis]
MTLQNGTKCPKGTRQARRVVATPAVVAPVAPRAPTLAPAPTPVAPVAGPALVPVPPSAAAGEPASVTARLPPPMLYACLTADAQRYYSEDAESTRCAPVDAVGLDGRSPAPAQACEVVRDRCTEVAEAERCAAWAERRRVAEQALTFAPEKFDAARDELARVDAAIAGTACAH